MRCTGSGFRLELRGICSTCGNEDIVPGLQTVGMHRRREGHSPVPKRVTAPHLPCAAGRMRPLGRARMGPQPRQESRGAAERPGQRFLPDQPRAFGVIFQHELARVKSFELGTVPDADDGGVREPLQDQAHQLVLAHGIEGGGGLVHHYQVWPMEEHAGKREPLFFAAGEDVFPLGVFIQPVEHMAQPHGLDRLTDDGLVQRLRRERIGHGTAQGAERHVRLLRHQEQPGIVDQDLSPPQGHRPAIARTSVLLPVPDAPTTRTFSPGAISISASWTTALPSCKVTDRFRNRSMPSSAG